MNVVLKQLWSLDLQKIHLTNKCARINRLQKLQQSEYVIHIYKAQQQVLFTL